MIAPLQKGPELGAVKVGQSDGAELGLKLPEGESLGRPLGLALLVGRSDGAELGFKLPEGESLGGSVGDTLWL
jgi:hypothetical protein